MECHSALAAEYLKSCFFAGPGGRRFWNTRLLANGGYRLTVSAWDRRGNRATRSVIVVVSN